jgi:dihydrofolate reductase
MQTTNEENDMGRVVVTEFVSLDGVMEDPGGAEDFAHGGWVFKFDRGPEGDKVKLDELANSEAQLLGRVTYEAFAKAWPEREGEFADFMNGMPKYVVSSTLSDPTWNNTTVLSGDVADAVGQLKERVEGDILVAGSNTLVHALLANDLVDELRLMVFPVVLGSGKRLFPEGKEMAAFHLAESNAVGDGVLTLVYWPKAL